MSNIAPIIKKDSTPDLSQLEQVLIKGDLASLSPEQRIQYCQRVCEMVGISWLTKPFEYIPLNGKLTLYALKSATDQLRKVHRISIKITGREMVDDIYRVTAAAQMPDGRVDEDTGAVNVANLKGEILANALMKAETKAKRRVTLSICGLGMLDETEVEDIPDKAKNPYVMEQPSPDVGVQEEGFVIKYGPLAKQYVHQADPAKLRDYIEGIYKKAEALNKPIPKWAEALIEAATPYIGAWENQPIDEPGWDG